MVSNFNIKNHEEGNLPRLLKKKLGWFARQVLALLP